jgi:hypothetical protein
MVAVKRFTVNTIIASKDSTAIIERYMTVITGNDTETAIVNFETGLDRGLFRYERFIEKPISPYH